MQSTEQILSSTPGSSQLPTSSQTPSRVLVVEPHPTLRTVLVQRLRQDGHLAAAVGTAAEAIDLCREQSPDLLVSAEILELFAIFNQFAIVAKTWLLVFIHHLILNSIVMVISKH